MKRLYFIRHGQSVLNVAGLFAGSTDTPLTAEGRKQAKQAGIAAKRLQIDAIVSSPLKRAVQTAEIIAIELRYPKDKIHKSPLLAERHFGELEGQPWHPDLDLDGVVDIETVDTILERAKLALEFLNTLDADNILVVSHGSFGRALRSLVLPNMPFHNRSTGGSNKSGLRNAEIVAFIEEN